MEQDAKMAFSNRLRSLRVKRDMSQEELAERVGVSRTSIGFYERGRIPPAKTIQRLADVLGIPAAYLTTGNSDESLMARWDQALKELKQAGCEVEPIPNERVRIYHTAQLIVEAKMADIQAVVETVLSDAEKRRADYIKHRLAAELPYITPE